MKISRAKRKLKIAPCKPTDIFEWQLSHIKKSLQQADNRIYAKNSDVKKFFDKIKILK